MTRDEIEALFARRQEDYERLDAAALAADYSDTCVVETAWAGAPLIGREATEQAFRTFFAAFPDLQRHPKVLLIDGDQVAEFGTSSGTDMGGFLELEPTRKAFRIPIVFLYTLKDRQIVRERRIYDYTSLLMQIGILKVKPT